MISELFIFSFSFLNVLGQFLNLLLEVLGLFSDLLLLVLLLLRLVFVLDDFLDQLAVVIC